MKSLTTILLLFTFTGSGLALKPDTTYHWKPNVYGMMFKEYNVKTSDNYTLKAWFYPAQKALSRDSMIYYFNKKTEIRPYKINKDKKPTIIICNGDAGNMEQLLDFAYTYSTSGFNVLTFDWRGFGESQAFPIDTNYMVYSEFIIDYDAVIDFTKQIETVDANKIGVFGFSTGAFLSFAIATKRKEIKAIVTRGIFSDYKNIVTRLKEINSNDTYWIPENIDDFSPKNNWKNFTTPIFLIVGENDKRTPKECSVEIISNVKSNIRELWVVENAAHGGKLAPEILEESLFYEKTIRFYKENL
ncbi:MAG: alpha/beta fold hydrolase [Bacteroidales bacterium]|nr:alpha/beta fold hydrolase [Bacteroidales bacterium]